MTTKEKLLELFEAHKGTFFSGEDIAKNIGCSRTAVWKAVQGLRNDGGRYGHRFRTGHTKIP